MGQQKITEKDVAQKLLESANVLVTQPMEQEDGSIKESLRRVPLAVFLAELYDARKDNPDADTGDVLEYPSVGDFLRAISKQIASANLDVDLSNLDFDEDEENNILYLYDTKKEKRLGAGWTIKGGSGDGSTTKMRVTNLMDSLTLQILDGESLALRYNFTSTEDGVETGDGTAQYYVGGILRETATIKQGENTWDCSKWLTAGESNAVKITVTDNLGNTRTLPYTVTSISIYHTDTFDATAQYTGDVTYRFYAYGDVSKTFHLSIDGTELESAKTEITTSGRQSSVTIPKQTHGSHLIKTWLTTDVGGMEVPGNVITHDVVWMTDGNETPIIASNFAQETAVQGDAIDIPWLAIDPTKLTADVTLWVNEDEVSSLTVDRIQQTWTITDYPTGEVTFTIKCGITQKSFVVQVSESTVGAEVTTTGALLMLSAAGRSSSEKEDTINTWPSKVGDIVGTLTDFNHRSNGWMGRYLRVSGGARVSVPMKIFESDFRADGRTIEFDIRLHNVQNKYASVISCLSGGIGLNITGQQATIKSEQTSTSAIYGTKQRLRIAFTVESKAENRLIRTYINGFCCGSKVYPATDNFAQASPVEITIGSDYAVVDIYDINVYDHCLTQYEMADNYIATRDTSEEKALLYSRNQVYTTSGEISLENVMKQYPAMVIIGELPKSKGDKKIVNILFYNPDDPTKNFLIEGVTIDVQGTSSQFYPTKNYKYTTGTVYILTGTIGETTFCLKANYMDSSGKRNTGTANLMQSMYTEKTPPQQENEKLRTTIEGYSIVLFHATSDTATPTFVGLYDFNTDKSSTDSLGLTDPEKHQAWELCNTSPRCLWQSNDFSTGDVGNDFESRYPDKFTDYSALERLSTWILSCKGDPEKFKAEASQHLNIHYGNVYYIMAHVLCACDSLGKNMHIACWNIGEDNEVWYIIWYDVDSIIGLNNVGENVFTPGKEFSDIIGTESVFNGAKSLLWELWGAAFKDEIAAEYQAMRSDGRLTLERLMQFYNADNICQSRALYNADGDVKYIEPYVRDGDGTYLYANQGPGDAYFEWWLTESLSYFDSLWQGGDYTTDYAVLRVYTPTQWSGVEPNADLSLRFNSPGYSRVKYVSYITEQRVGEYEDVVMEAPDIEFNHAETIVYRASSLVSLGDLSDKYLGSLDVHNATHLGEIIAGSAVEGYSNTNLTELIVGELPELLKVDVRNCPNFGTVSGNIDLSGCGNIREVYTEGTAVTGVTLPTGGYLRVLHLEKPTSLIVRHHPSLADLQINNYDALATIWIEGKSSIDELAQVQAAPNLARVRLTDMDWNLPDASLLLALSKKKGLDENGGNTDVAIITGKAHIASVGEGQLARLAAAFPNLEITYDTLHPLNTVQFVNSDGTVLDTQYVDYGEAAEDPVTRAVNPIPEPTMEPDVARVYSYKGWSADFSKVVGDMVITATYTASTRQYTVRFLVEGVVAQESTVYYNESVEYTGEVPQKTAANKFYLFNCWDATATNVAADMDINATFYESDMYPEQKAFADCNPAEIYRICESGKYAEYWAVGDKVEITLTTGEVITQMIHAFDYYDLADGTGKAPVACYPTGILNETCPINKSNVNAGGFPASYAKSWLNDIWFYRLPWAWQYIIKPVIIKSSKGGGPVDGNNPYEIVSCECKVYYPSHAEMGFDTTATPYSLECGQTVTLEDGTVKGVAFACYTDNASRVKRPNNNTGAAAYYNTRSPEPSSASSWRYVINYGYANTYYASSSYGSPPGFSF